MTDAASDFAHDWSAELLRQPPLIAPARQYVWPQAIPGEEDALARGALRVQVRPATGARYLLTCALGFADPSMPSGIFACPNPRDLCVVAGGYAYIASAETPERVKLLGLRPVVAVSAAVEAGLLLFVGFQTVVAWGAAGLQWQSKPLSWEGVRLTEVDRQSVRGFGWDLISDRELEFVLNLETGEHTGGGYRMLQQSAK